MYFDRAKIKKNAKMVRIAMPDAEADKMIPDMEGVIEWIAGLDDADVEGVEPLITTADFPLRLEPDEVKRENTRDEVLGSAPDRRGDYYAVPKIIE